MCNPHVGTLVFIKIDFLQPYSVPPSRTMTPAEQLDIIRSFEEVESIDDEGVSKRDLEVS